MGEAKGGEQMEISLEKTDLRFYQQLESAGTSFEADAEMVVPDQMPDIGEIICVTGIPLLRSKDLSDGRLSVSGSIRANILYTPETDTTLKMLETEIPFSFYADTAAPQESKVTAAVRLAYVDARTRNPRKLSIHCELCAEYSAYMETEIGIGGDIPENDARALCLKRERTSADLVDGIWEKTFIVTDTYPLEGAKSAACELLSRNVELFQEDVKFVGSKMILKGLIRTSLLWRTEAEELCSSVYSSGFSQILDVGELAEASADAILSLTGAYLELQDGNTVTAELHILAQAVCSQRMEIPYISDVYSNLHPLQAYFGAPLNLCLYETAEMTDSMRGMIETPYAVREIVYAAADVGLWSVSESGFTCPINVRLLLRDEDNTLHGIVRSFAAEWNVPVKEKGAAFMQEVRCRDLSVSPSSGGAEVRLQAAAIVRSRNLREIAPVESIELDDTTRIDLSAYPSITVLPAKREELWPLAKRYHSTVSLIEEANRSLSGSVMLIPRAR